MKKLKPYILLSGLFFYFASAFSAEIKPEYIPALIPDSLKKDAYAVVRQSTTSFEYKSQTNGVENETYVITILDKKGKDGADFYAYTDKFRTLKSFSAKLYDADGKLYKKYGMSDLGSTEYTDSHTLTDDSKRYFFSPDIPIYPFTIVYEYSINYVNGILTFPAFSPIGASNTSVEKATYSINLPADLKYQYKAFHLAEKKTETNAKNGSITLTWEAKNLMAIVDEPFMGQYEDYAPLLFIRPVNFTYDNVQGTINDWESMGKWDFSLVKDRNSLPDDFVTKIKAMVANAKTDREEVKILYDFLGTNTRYVSIQLGIGGYQPMLASDVYKYGYGDCKGLSNYLKSMLDAIGIKSNYTSIRLDEDKKLLYTDFANFNQLNHVILQVPLKNDTLWLECTNPKNPFGFVHNGIAGHDALVENDGEAKLCRLPDYPDSINITSYHSTIQLQATGSCNAQVLKKYEVKEYDNIFGFALKKPNEQADAMRRNIYIPTVEMGNLSFTENKTALPSIDIDFSWSSPQYGTKTGSRLFIPVNPYRKTYEGLKKKGRIHDLVINSGSKDIDSIVIDIPDGFEIESLPAPQFFSNQFGSFQSIVAIKNKQLIVLQTAFYKSGTWKAEEYSDFMTLIDKITAGYKSRAILKKSDA